MKVYTRIISAACLAGFILFAVSTPAQDQAVPLRDRLHQIKPFNGNAADESKTQEQPKSDSVSSNATTACTYTFTTGSGITYLKFCVTVNGNIVEFQSPAGVEQIAQGNIREGYGLCDATTNTEYWDYAHTDSGNWGAPTTVTHTATEVKIERTTSDGAWTLTQIISLVTGTNPYAKVEMLLKNNSAVTKGAFLMRFANVDPGYNANTDTNFVENFDGTDNSAWGYISSSGTPAYGMMIQNVGSPTPASGLLEQVGYGQTTSAGPAPCTPFATAGSPVLNADGSIVYLYDFSLTKEQTATMTTKYFSF